MENVIINKTRKRFIKKLNSKLQAYDILTGSLIYKK